MTGETWTVGMGRPALPGPARHPSESDASALDQWLDFGIRYESYGHLRRMAIYNLADLYSQNIQTWLTKTYNTDPGITTHWALWQWREGEDRIPTPMMDEFSGPIEHEAARLARPKYRAYVRPSGLRPDLKARDAAAQSTRVLKDVLYRTAWDRESDRFHIHMPQYGGAFVETFFQRDWEREVERRPVRGGVACPECGFRLSSPTVSMDMLMGARPGMLNLGALSFGEGQAEPSPIEHCLVCREPAPKPVENMEAVPTDVPDRPWTPPLMAPFEAEGPDLYGKDFFGRPLGEDQAVGEARMRVLDPRDIFPENDGIGVQPGDIREWWSVEYLSIDVVRNRYDRGHLVEAEHPATVMEHHGIAGHPALMYDEHTSLFTHHAVIRRYCRRPYREWQEIKGHPDGGRLVMNRGRLIEQARGPTGPVTLVDGDLEVESKNNPGVFVALRELDYVPWKLRSGGLQLHGVSMSEGLFDACDGSNEIWSQLQQCRRATGMPKWLIESGMRFGYSPGGKAGSVWTWQYNPLKPDLRPTQVDNELMNGQVYEELRERRAYIDRHSAVSETDRGQPPPGVTAQIAFQYLVEQSSIRRAPRMERIKNLLQRRYTHLLKLCHEMVPESEQRVLWEELGDGKWRQRVWNGMSLAGQTDVIVEIEPDSDSALIEQQAAQTAVNLMPQIMESARSRRIVARKIRVPSEIFELDDAQQQCAEREYIDYQELGRVPICDESLDDHAMHDEQHGYDCLEADWYDHEEVGLWDEALVWLADWEELFWVGGEALYKLLGLKPPPQIDPETGEELPPSPLNPPPPMPGINVQMGTKWPPLIEVRIFEAWKLILLQRAPQLLVGAPPDTWRLLVGAALEKGIVIQAPNGQLLPPPMTPEQQQQLQQQQQQAQELIYVMRFRAHREGHRVALNKQKALAMSGVPVPAAPGGEETASGTVPAPGQPEVETAAAQPAASGGGA